MRDKLYNKKDIIKQYHIEPPLPIRASKLFTDQLNQCQMIKENITEGLIDNSSWTKLPVFMRKENNRRRSLLIRKSEFMDDIRNKNDFNEIQLIPILMFRNCNYEIHHVIILEIDNGINIGLSLIYREEKVEVTAIHTDKSSLYSQHQWISLHHMNECECFDSFNSSINHLSIGNPDDLQNKYNASQKENKKLRNRLKSKDRLSSPSSSSSQYMLTGSVDSSRSNSSY